MCLGIPLPFLFLLGFEQTSATGGGPPLGTVPWLEEDRVAISNAGSPPLNLRPPTARHHPMPCLIKERNGRPAAPWARSWGNQLLLLSGVWRRPVPKKNGILHLRRSLAAFQGQESVAKSITDDLLPFARSRCSPEIERARADMLSRKLGRLGTPPSPPS